MNAPLDLRPAVLLVDDEPVNLQVLRHVLQDDFRLLFARDGHKAIELAAAQQPSLILLDVMMPGMHGYDVCRALKQRADTERIPVIFVTALTDSDEESHGFEVGAVDYITKPISPPVVRARVRTHLSLVRVDELLETRLQVIQRLGRAAEYKDNETGLHVVRMSHYSRVLALAAGLGERFAEKILHASPMHDIGKIGIPDAILQKPGKLDADEWAVMRRHPEIGAEIIGDDRSPLLQMARRVALNHHEKWDGSGYPAGLRGEDIPVEARIVALADVFDALTSIRPYKRPWTVEDAVALIRQEAGSHFDPQLAGRFIEQLPELLKIKTRWEETGDDAVA
ncbi:MAG: response regulator [Azonexaceae bacterium]|uniref:HD-GYP domain-containing protein n=1 Tax=Azonexus sp. R2A61 TaxID=2744443 RepID=UPI001F258CAE|nr:HD domain-containing phosphohydrolase [Azonexus sp. R2A61]MCE1240132.1 response regulator [Azonexaceae bacterium]